MSEMKQLERKATKRAEAVESEPVETADTTESTALLAETDALLDEIDRLLDIAPTETVEAAPEPQRVSLADLMRKGSEMAPQAIGAWETNKGETCALQAAMYAAKAENLI